MAATVQSYWFSRTGANSGECKAMGEWKRESLTVKGTDDGNELQESPLHVHHTVKVFKWVTGVLAGNR